MGYSSSLVPYQLSFPLLRCAIISFQRSYAEANNGFNESLNVREKGSSLSRDDRVHGSMLIINELLMNCAWSDEVGVVKYLHVVTGL